MLDADEVADVEGDAVAATRMAGFEADDAPSVGEISLALVGVRPRLIEGLDGEARLEPLADGWDLQVNPALPKSRQRFKAAHELGHWYYDRCGYRGADIEARCDLFAAALVMPRSVFRRAVRTLGHRVHALANAFATTQSAALLRVGEVTGRPVALLRWPEALTRGEPFTWPKSATLVRALREGKDAVHPLRIVDEPNRVGLMARR